MKILGKFIKLSLQLFKSFICLKISNIQEQENLIKRSDITKREIASKLNVTVDDLKMRILPSPTTTCTAPKCIDVINVNGHSKIDYKQKCHIDCKLSAVQSNIIGKLKKNYSIQKLQLSFFIVPTTR